MGGGGGRTGGVGGRGPQAGTLVVDIARSQATNYGTRYVRKLNGSVEVGGTILIR